MPDIANVGNLLNADVSKWMPILKNLFFMVAFIISFITFNIRSSEYLGLGLFSAINIVYCLTTLRGLIGIDSKTAFHGFSTIVALILSFVSTILLLMTIVTIRNKFYSHGKSEIRLSETRRDEFNSVKMLFTTITVFIGVASTYVYFTAD